MPLTLDQGFQRYVPGIGSGPVLPCSGSHPETSEWSLQVAIGCAACDDCSGLATCFFTTAVQHHPTAVALGHAVQPHAGGGSEQAGYPCARLEQENSHTL